jgi:hypothetical protein
MEHNSWYVQIAASREREGGGGLEEEKTKYDKGAEHDQKTGDKILLNFFLCECCKKRKG